MDSTVALEPMKLHIGGSERREGWIILNIMPGGHVDRVGDCRDLSFLPDKSCSQVYASHVLEHLGYNGDLQTALKEIWRVLQPGGLLQVSVPDLRILCGLFLRGGLTRNKRFHIMRMMFGGRVDMHDIHYSGLTFEFLSGFLEEAGFRKNSARAGIRRVCRHQPSALRRRIDQPERRGLQVALPSLVPEGNSSSSVPPIGGARKPPAQRLANAMTHEPRGLVAHANGAVELVGAAALPGQQDHVEGKQPLVERHVAVLHDGADRHGERAFAGLAVVAARCGLAYAFCPWLAPCGARPSSAPGKWRRRRHRSGRTRCRLASGCPQRGHARRLRR